MHGLFGSFADGVFYPRKWSLALDDCEQGSKRTAVCRRRWCSDRKVLAQPWAQRSL